MRSFRSRPVGWRNESYRHYLASKGIASKMRVGTNYLAQKGISTRHKYFMPFVEKTTVPVIDFPEEYNSVREKSIVRMSPDEFLKLTKKTSENTASRESRDRLLNMSQEEYEKSISEEHKLKRIREGLKEGKDIPIGYIEYAPEGNKPVEHEGRHRALVAKELGMNEIPVVLIRGRELVPSKGGGMGHWAYGKDEEFGERKKILPFKYQSKKQDYRINYKRYSGSNGEMALVGVDAKGRRVRKYDEKHWQAADKEKYLRAAKLKHDMPKVMDQLKKDSFSDDQDTRKNARAVLVIAKTGMRPGTRKDMKADQQSYGVTTLKKSHVQTSGSKVNFNFVGKHGIHIKQSVKDPVLAKVVKAQKADAKGQELFPHTSDATLRNYLYKTSNYKPKDFRTVKANHIAEKLVKAGVKKDDVTKAVAQQLANTPKVSENSYIDPKVFRGMK